jgi:arsenate reductase
MAKVTIYHNPRCSKSRETLALLKGRGIEPKVIEYLQAPPSRSELKTLLRMLRLKPRQLLRSKEDAYRTAGLDNDSLDDNAIIAAMTAHPVLIERPIVVVGERAVIGRPPETVLELL